MYLDECVEPDLERRHAVLAQCEHRCHRCGAEDGHVVWRTMDGETRHWIALQPSAPPHVERGLVRVAVFVVQIPEADALAALCGGCWLLLEIARADRAHRAAVPTPKRLMKPPRALPASPRLFE